jgi:hypothetical protein
LGACDRALLYLVRRHVTKGLFGDPKHGGNRETIG